MSSGNSSSFSMPQNVNVVSDNAMWIAILKQAFPKVIKGRFKQESGGITEFVFLGHALDSGEYVRILGCVLDSGTCFWIRGSVLDSGKCFGFWDVFLDSGKFFGFWDVFWILGRVFGFWEVFRILGRVLDCPYEPP